MNCFQNCIFTYDSQRRDYGQDANSCCELLSELYFYLWFPTVSWSRNISCLLWIAFRIVFLLMIPNPIKAQLKRDLVVNCFQNCIFTYDSQRKRIKKEWSSCCELLSELYFYLWFPTQKAIELLMKCCELLSELYFYLWFPTRTCKYPLCISLWIAFRIVFLLMIPNTVAVDVPAVSVVNCFQNCIFTYDSQLSCV